MPELEDAAEQDVAKKRNRKRRQQLIELIDKIVSGELEQDDIPLDELFKMHTSVRDQYQLGGPRRQYISPADRSSYDYGYMKVHEMGTT